MLLLAYDDLADESITVLVAVAVAGFVVLVFEEEPTTIGGLFWSP